MNHLGKYKLHEPLGKGSFGTVYRATDTNLDRVVALKVLHPQLAADTDFVKHFRSEARIIAKLDHPNIVTIYEFGEFEGRFFIAMKYLSGGNLAARLAGGALRFELAASILLQVCAGLQAAHKIGLVHRDLKPANILFDENGQAVISDFGLARAFVTSGSSSSSTGVVGTPYYRAPELWRGKPATPAADVYSLGCTLVEMLTGISPFHGHTPDEVLTGHLIKGPDFGPVWPPPGSPPELKAVIARALDKEPSQRYANAISLAGALQTLLRSLGLGANAQLPARKTSWLLYAGVGIVILAVLVGLTNLLWRPTSQPTPIPAPPSTAVLTPTITSNPTTTFTPTEIFTLMPTRPATLVPTLTLDASPKLPPGMGFIPGGPFQMGSQSNQAKSDERPVHTVTLSAFGMDLYEVTNAEYAKCVVAGKCKPPASPSSNTRSEYYDSERYAQYPVVNVSWNDADAYCKWRGARLPGEAEWEKAARGGLEGKWFPWGDMTPVCTTGVTNGAQFWGCPVQDTVAVGSFAANGYGLFDMSGNVWEWVNDWYAENYYSTSPGNNPPGPTGGPYKVERGGGWSLGLLSTHISARVPFLPTSHDHDLGFRCAVSLP